MSNPPPPSPVSTHPMVTWSVAGIVKLVHKLNLHTQDISPTPRSYLQAFNDPNWLKAR